MTNTTEKALEIFTLTVWGNPNPLGSDHTVNAKSSLRM